MNKGYFITVEGVEGVGKSTNIDFIAKLLTEQGKPVLTTREPGGSPIAEQIRAILRHKQEEIIHPNAELLLLFAARAQHLEQVIKPAMAEGQWVVCDRFTDASYAYQGAGRGMAKEVISYLEQFVQQGFKPDLTLLLDLDVNTGLDRVLQRGAKDRWEEEDVGFFNRVRDAYLQMANEEPQRYRVVDANRSIEEVQESIKGIIEDIVL